MRFTFSLAMTRTVLVTGAASGIGAGTCQAFKESSGDWLVIGVDRQKLINQSIAANIDKFHIVDLSKPNEIESLANQISQEHGGKLNALVDCAGINDVVEPIERMTLETYEKLMSVNLRAPWLLCKYFKPMLKNTQGSIINIASVHSIASMSLTSVYAASKGGLSALTRALAVEFGPDKIRVNAVCPGAVDTPLHRIHMENTESPKGLTDIGDKVNEWSEAHATLGRVGQPIEIGKSVVFLADNDRSAFITGENMVVDGGLLCRLTTV